MYPLLEKTNKLYVRKEQNITKIIIYKVILKNKYKKF